MGIGFVREIILFFSRGFNRIESIKVNSIITVLVGVARPNAPYVNVCISTKWQRYPKMK